MKVSIVTICYNSETYIESAVNSVLSQRYPDIEYILVDGGSQDSTLEVIEKYRDKIDVLISEPDNGIYDAMNKGISAATGDVVGILNSDDVYADELVIADVVEILREEKSDAVYGDLVYVDAADIKKIKRTWISGKYLPGMFSKGWMPPHPTFFVKKDIYLKYGNFNISLSSSADYELMLRFIHKHQIRLSYLNRVMVRMRVGGQSNASLKNRIRANREDKKAWELNGLKPGTFTLIMKPARKIFQFLRK